MITAKDWHVTQITHGSAEGRCHSHAYYDIPVLDSSDRFLVGHQTGFAERHPAPDDRIEIGLIDLDGDRRWQPVGTSRAWSWQQGAMSQWLPGGRTLVWNDREADRFVARTLDLDAGTTATLPRPVYAVHPDGRTALSLNMARLQHVRPGYGYAGGAGAGLDRRHPEDDGVWRIDLVDGTDRLILSLDAAVTFALSRRPLRERLIHRLRHYTYWFNHVKISPSGNRFTVKLRFRQLGKGWNETMGFSLTGATDGGDLRLLDDATSHVIWLDDRQLYLWRRGGVYLYDDRAPTGRATAQLAPQLLRSNVHIRHLPSQPDQFVFDTPYAEQVDLLLLDRATGDSARIARFDNHRPPRGPFRCDLHPVPSGDGRRIVVASLHDGGRQIYLVERNAGAPQP